MGKDLVEKKMEEMVGIICNQLCQHPVKVTDQEALEDIC